MLNKITKRAPRRARAQPPDAEKEAGSEEYDRNAGEEHKQKRPARCRTNCVKTLKRCWLRILGFRQLKGLVFLFLEFILLSTHINVVAKRRAAANNLEIVQSNQL